MKPAAKTDHSRLIEQDRAALSLGIDAEVEALHGGEGVDVVRDVVVVRHLDRRAHDNDRELGREADPSLRNGDAFRRRRFRKGAFQPDDGLVAFDPSGDVAGVGGSTCENEQRTRCNQYDSFHVFCDLLI